MARVARFVGDVAAPPYRENEIKPRILNSIIPGFGRKKAHEAQNWEEGKGSQGNVWQGNITGNGAVNSEFDSSLSWACFSICLFILAK
jgi:hypothetical protein